MLTFGAWCQLEHWDMYWRVARQEATSSTARSLSDGAAQSHHSPSDMKQHPLLESNSTALRGSTQTLTCDLVSVSDSLQLFLCFMFVLFFHFQSSVGLVENNSNSLTLEVLYTK